jgi:hypothetical protein
MEHFTRSQEKGELARTNKGNNMKNKYYETISPSLAKKRIAKLVEAKREAFATYEKVKDLGSKALTKYWRERSFYYGEALREMGIVAVDCLED